ncbi:choice-of-anchor P family protein [Nocardioides caeni]|uniref:YceI family protein n=1 Tax=Nocardioides caeni TaxID=574700 RepID=A0A4S8ND98_9ACTN|nr:choice-of-anchor P family protein [Nocardioides caeni]THV14563.1 hypothetical protein E9934_07770 [Nocardioides caeni]
MRKLLTFFAFVLTGVALTAVPAPAQAAPVWYYSASTGATYVNVLNSTVSSDLTAQTSISGGPSKTAQNSTAAVDVSKLLSVGAAQTKTSAVNTGNEVTMTSWARTAGVNLLNGLITADALETTTTTVGKADGTVSATGETKLLGLKIIGVKLPLTIPKNYSVSIPGVATITANTTIQKGDSELSSTNSWALAVQLLKPRDGYAAGVTLIVNPMVQYITGVEPSSEPARLAGFSFSSRVQANVGDAVKVVSDPTAYIGVPMAGSNGNTLKNSTVSANVPGVLTLGTLTSTSTSSRDEVGNADVLTTNKTAGINVLGGLVKADAIEVSAHGVYKLNTQTNKFEYTSELKMTTLNLVIAGQAIPVNVGPNTTLNILGLGKVELNKQVTYPGSKMNRIDGLKITLDTAQAGLPVGATIEFAIAATIITPGSNG